VAVKLTGQWRKASRILRKGRRLRGVIDRALLQEAHWFRKQVVQGIRKQAPGGRQFTPLKPATIAAKGSSKALIDQNTLLRSIQVKKAGRKGVFVGVLRTATSKDGKKMVDIAAVHEFGAPKAKIPKRSFLQATEDKFGPTSPKRMLARVARLLGGDFGVLLFPPGEGK